MLGHLCWDVCQVLDCFFRDVTGNATGSADFRPGNVLVQCLVISILQRRLLDRFGGSAYLSGISSVGSGGNFVVLLILRHSTSETNHSVSEM